jgi:hypothetical protein
MNTQCDRSPSRPDKLHRHLSPVTGVLMALLALGLACTPQGSAETLRPLAAAQPRVDSPIRVLTDRAGLRVECREARPADVLRALGARTGVTVTVEGELPGRITRAFTVASVEDAVREVIRGYPTALVFENDRAIRVIALGSAPGDGAPASPPPTATTTPPGAGQARAAADETAPGADPDPVLTEDDGGHHRRSAPSDSGPTARRQVVGDPGSAARQGAAQAPRQRNPGPAQATPDTAGAGRQQAFRAELMETLMRAIRPSTIATSRTRTDGQGQ